MKERATRIREADGREVAGWTTEHGVTVVHGRTEMIAFGCTFETAGKFGRWLVWTWLVWRWERFWGRLRRRKDMP